MDANDKRLYEAMFLVDSALADSDADGVSAAVKGILDGAGVDVVSIKRWGERKLAYEINGKSRGTYYLCYFNAEPGGIGGIERSVQLSEQIMRVLILRPPAESASKSESAEQAKETEQTEQAEETKTEGS